MGVPTRRYRTTPTRRGRLLVGRWLGSSQRQGGRLWAPACIKIRQNLIHARGATFPEVSFRHFRHIYREYNTIADVLSKEAVDGGRRASGPRAAAELRLTLTHTQKDATPWLRVCAAMPRHMRDRVRP